MLDTNVVSELVRPAPDLSVLRFFQAQALAALFVPSIVLAELRYGTHRIPAGQRRRELEQAIDTFFKVGLSNRVLVFDEACANGYAVARATRQAAGLPVSAQDALIGGMALAHGATMATHNTEDFVGYGLIVVNPWLASGAVP